MFGNTTVSSILTSKNVQKIFSASIPNCVSNVGV